MKYKALAFIYVSLLVGTFSSEAYAAEQTAQTPVGITITQSEIVPTPNQIVPLNQPQCRSRDRPLKLPRTNEEQLPYLSVLGSLLLATAAIIITKKEGREYEEKITRYSRFTGIINKCKCRSATKSGQRGGSN